MIELVIRARENGEIRLGLGELVGGERPLATHDGAAVQREYEQLGQPVDGRAMWRADRAHGDQRPFDELDALVLESAELDELVVLNATERANAIRSNFLATGLSGAATEQIAEGNKDAALALYRRALAAMDPPNPLFEETRTEIEEIVKGMTAPPVKPPVRRPVKSK